jgi:MFS transporter, ACS family, tartrate transporter
VTARPHDAPGPRTLAKVQRRLLPLLFGMYVAALLTRGNVGLAALQMQRDLAFSATTFGLGAGMFILGYAPFAIPSNLFITRIGARRWIAPMLIVSGLLGSAMMLVRSPLSFYVLRFLLGVAEAGFFPGVIYYLSHWMPSEHRARVTARFMAAIPLAGVVSGGLASVLLALGGRLGLAGWQWVFLVEGAPAVLLGLAALLTLPDAPAQARWLYPEERTWLVERLREEQAPRHQPGGRDLRAALADRAVWRLGSLAFLVLASAYAYGLWSPQLIKSMTTLSDARVSLTTSAIALVSVVAMLINASHSDLRQERRLHIAVPVSLMALGWLACAWLPSGTLCVMALALVAIGIHGQYGPFWSLPGSLPAGKARAGGIALLHAVGSFGGFVGPNVIGLIKDATGGFRLAYAVLGVLGCGAGVLALRLPRDAPRNSAASIG